MVQISRIWMAGLIFSGSIAQAGAISLTPAVPAAQAGAITIRFQLVDESTHQAITDQNLMIDHEKLLHFFVFDPALMVFEHVHPSFNGAVWTVDVNLPVNGDYWIWAQGELASSQQEFTAGNRLSVSCGQPANPVPPVLGNQRSGADGISAIALSNDVIHAGGTTMLMVTFSRTDGTQPQLSPYLGEMGHFTIVPADGSALIHTHPMATGMPNMMMIHAVFPAPGDYRIWAQFVDGGVLKTVPLSVTVGQ